MFSRVHIGALLFFYMSLAVAGTLSEEEKISLLIEKVKLSKVIFIRNGEEHSSFEASEHLQMKYKNATKSFFGFGRKKKVTAKDFIEKIASKSSVTGRPYQIRLPSGELVKSEDWLKATLKEIEKSKKK